MGTRYTHQIVDNPDGLMSGFGGAKRDRTADLLHAMQALSQLSYGPVKRCCVAAENEIITALLFSRKQFVKKFLHVMRLG